MNAPSVPQGSSDPSGVRVSEPTQAGRARSSESPLAQSWRDVLAAGFRSVCRSTSSSINSCASSWTSCPRCCRRAAFGACVVSRTVAAPVVISRLPLGMAVNIERDPTRLFPAFTTNESSSSRTARPVPRCTWRARCKRSARSKPRSARRPRWCSPQPCAVLRLYMRAEESARSIRKLQAQVIQNEKLASLGQIVAGVVHELNNPLTSIIAYSDYLKRKASSRPKYDEQDDELERLRRIGEAAARILNFSRDLVAYARPAADVPGTVQVARHRGKGAGFLRARVPGREASRSCASSTRVCRPCAAWPDSSRRCSSTCSPTRRTPWLATAASCGSSCTPTRPSTP